MKAVVIGPDGPRLETARPAPAPGAGEAVVRPLVVALTRLERDLAGGLFGFTGIPGRSFVGVVDEVAGDSSSDLVGARVVAEPRTWCGACPDCTRGLREHCPEGQRIGIDRDGALAERVAIPARHLVRIPDALDEERAVFALTVAAALQVRRQIAVEAANYITVLGDGPLGLVMAQVLAPLNATVRLVGRYSERLELCERWGVAHRHVDDIGRRADQDVVVDCTGAPSGLRVAVDLVRPRGRVVLKSLVAPGGWRGDVPPPLADVVLRETQLIGSGDGPLGDALALLESGGIDVDPLRAGRVRIEDAVDLLDPSRRGVLASVVAMR